MANIALVELHYRTLTLPAKSWGRLVDVRRKRSSAIANMLKWPFTPNYDSKCRNASSSGCACWCTDVLTARHRAILLRPSVQFPAIPRDTVSDLPVRQRYWFRRHAARHWATARFLWRQPKPGTLCLIMSGTRLHCSPSVSNLKLCCLGSRTLISCHVTDY